MATTKSWPTANDFPEEEKTEIIKMSALTTRGVWQFVKQRSIKTRFGSALVLTLMDEDGKTFDVWACESLKKKLQEKPKIEYEYILYEGLVKPDDPNKNAYNAYRLMKKAV